MTVLALTHPKTVRVNRTDFRDKLRETLNKARGCTVVAISANDQEGERLVLDKRYFDDLLSTVSSLVETLEITTDRKLFDQIVRAASTLETDTRSGKLHSFDDVFAED